MKHDSLPKNLTPEALGQWITTNKCETKINEEQIPLEEHEISELEHNSSLASRAIDKLKAQLKEITEYFKEGVAEPIVFTIFPTRGLKTLDANRMFADAAIELGHTTINTTIYGIMHPDTEKINFFDIEGNEYPDHQENMTPDQIKFHGTLFKGPSLEEEVNDKQKSKKKRSFTSVEISTGDGELLGTIEEGDLPWS